MENKVICQSPVTAFELPALFANAVILKLLGLSNQRIQDTNDAYIRHEMNHATDSAQLSDDGINDRLDAIIQQLKQTAEDTSAEACNEPVWCDP